MMEALGRSGLAVEALSGIKHGANGNADPAAWLDARGLAYEMVGGGAWAVGAGGIQADRPEHYRLMFQGVPITLHRDLPGDVGRSEFLRLFDEVLDRFRPDVLVNYGGDRLAHEIRSRARARGIAVVFTLHNFNYHSTQPFTTADAVIVPSRFAAEHYRRTLGLHCEVLSNIIDLGRVQIGAHDSQYVTFVTPSYEKGVYAFARIADELGRRRPDIPLLVVEGRGTERTLVDCGIDLRVHGNVSLMANTPDPRQFWSVTKLCLMPSLWWENQPLAAIEAMVNGIPVIGSDRGGIPETLGDAGVILPLPERLTSTTRELPTPEEIAPWVEAVIRLWDDPVVYRDHRERAHREAERWKTERLEASYAKFFFERVPGHSPHTLVSGPLHANDP